MRKEDFHSISNADESHCDDTVEFLTFSLGQMQNRLSEIGFAAERTCEEIRRDFRQFDLKIRRLLAESTETYAAEDDK